VTQPVERRVARVRLGVPRRGVTVARPERVVIDLDAVVGDRTEEPLADPFAHRLQPAGPADRAVGVAVDAEVDLRRVAEAGVVERLREEADL
jgi:hypothetical protein